MTAINLLRRQQEKTPAGRYATWRQRVPHAELLACCLVLAALPFATAFGHIIADTKYELAVDPGRFVAGGLTLWNAQQFGVLLNQTVGYLFPMGPFFILLKLIGIAGWVVQRLWLSSLIVAAFCGIVLLTRRLRIGTPRTRLAAGIAYAISPIALSMFGSTSGEFLQMAMAPWMIVPLTDMRPWLARADSGAGRRAAVIARTRAVACSGVAIGLASGMNAASTIAAMIPAVIYILTRPGIRTRIRMLCWWAPAVLLATALWLVPLVLLSKYGVSIVTYTESAQVTTSTTSLLNILRGTESWIGYQTTNGQPDHQMAFLLSVDLVPAMLTGLLAALGLAGLVHRGLPERRFLLWTLLAGAVIMSLAYVSSLGNPLEGPLLRLINGPASPFRNLWKFDPLVRLPLTAGFAYLLAIAWRSRQRIAVTVAAVASLGTLVVPALTAGVADQGSFSQIPGYWVDAADWLTAHAGNQAVLAEPAASFGEYTWGNPMDDVLQALTDVDWAERSLAVVGSPGNERLLDAVDADIAAGDGSAGLATSLARMGVKYIIVRNDLSANELDGTYPARVHQALAETPGVTLAAAFGPRIGGGDPNNAITDFHTKYRAVQIYQVSGAQPLAAVQSAAATVRVYGAPEALITLASEKLLGEGPVLLNDDGPGQPAAGQVNTDTLRKRVVNFGELRTNFSPTLAANQTGNTFLSTDDFTEPGWGKYEAVARYAGIKSVTASSSASDITAFPSQWSTAGQPYAAFDGNADTAWESGSFTGPLGQWLQATFDTTIRFGKPVKVAFDENPTVGPPVTKVTVTTAAGTVSEAVKITAKAQPLRVPAGESDWLRITVTGLENQDITPLFGTQAGISSVAIPGVKPSMTIVTPKVAGPGPAAPGPAATVLAKAQPYQPGCMLTSVRWVCSPLLARETEEQHGFDESFTEATPAKAKLSGTVLLPDPYQVANYAFFIAFGPQVIATSSYTNDPQDQAWSAFDGNPATTWVASTADTHPKLAINWGHPVTLSKITIDRPPGASGSAQLVISGSKGQLRGAVIGKSGVVTFKPMKTANLTLTFTTDRAPVQVTDVKIPGVRFLTAPTQPMNLDCGSGPAIKVDGKTVRTTLSGTFAAVVDGQPLHYASCGAVPLKAGSNTVTESPKDAFDVQTAVLTKTGAAGARLARAAKAAAPQAADVVSWGPAQRSVRVDTSTRSYLEVNENYNIGWVAVLGGQTLTPVRLDGWKQAWVLPAGSSGLVTLSYKPSSLYRDSVAAGLAALTVLILLAIGLGVPWRRGWTAVRRRPPAGGPGGSTALDSTAPDLLAPDRGIPGYQAQPNEREPLSWATSAPPGWVARHLGRRYPRMPRVLSYALLIAVAVVTGLLFGGYPGAITVPIVALLLTIEVRGRRIGPLPIVLGGLLLIAAVIGAIGEHLSFSGDSGSFVTVTSDAIPQVICLIVIAGLLAALHRESTDSGAGQ
jgi:arabinofuranan 3-O-arabinosyltransferase